MTAIKLNSSDNFGCYLNAHRKGAMPLAVIRTNLSKASVPNNLMETVSAFMVKLLESDEKVCLFLSDIYAN